ncbi:DUF1573 domain-containing protein [Flavobacterium sp.]|uniref:DUF1573 domain-containing protein n=1 Tax=Flavobacterium sp. TaxID=239 RepID=UPI0037502C94
MMIKNSISVIAFLVLFLTLSCKKQDESAEFRFDAKNNFLPQNSQLAIPTVDKNKKPEDYPIIKIDDSNFDFGTINEGDKVEHIFKFTNTGNGTLMVITAQPSCGCTVPEWKKNPLKKGESGEIKIIFNSAGKSGQQQKTVYLTTNTLSGNDIITFKANILPKKETIKIK